MKPLYQTRATPDVLLEVAGKLKPPVDAAVEDVRGDAEGGVRHAGRRSRRRRVDVAQSRAAGGRVEVGAAAPAAAAARSRATPSRVFDGDAAQYPVPLPARISSPQFRDGSLAHLPWLQEMPDPLTSAMWSSWVEINPQTAERLRHRAGRPRRGRARRTASLRAPAMIVPGIAPDVIAMPVGQGHETFTRYASGRGVNPIAILAPVGRSRRPARSRGRRRACRSRASAIPTAA